jgi:hypothetical protein
LTNNKAQSKIKYHTKHLEYQCNTKQLFHQSKKCTNLFYIVFFSIHFCLNKEKSHNIDIKHLHLILINVNCYQEQKNIFSYKAYAVIRFYCLLFLNSFYSLLLTILLKYFSKLCLIHLKSNLYNNLMLQG